MPRPVPATTPRRRPARPQVPALLMVAALVGATACGGSDGRITKVDGPATTTTAERSTTTGTTPATDAGADAGLADVGDPLTPGAGNGGYDVGSYFLDVDVSDDRTTVDAITSIDATATEDLTSFHLDLRGLTVESVTVDGDDADFTRDGDELIVTPARRLRSGDRFATVVTTTGTPRPVADPSAPGTIGWLSADTGSGTFVASEPVGAKGWFPCNDHPSDKATFAIRVTAAADDTVVANGRLVGTEPLAGGARTRWKFDQTDPMATYLVQVAVGDYEVVESTGPGGLPLRHAIVRSVPAAQRTVLDETAAQIEFFSSKFGAFPLDTYGVLVADAPPEFALETQTLTLLPASWLSDSVEFTSAVLAHELAHQWFGDAVTPARWTDIWLNEGFATYAEWMWNEHQGRATVADQAEAARTQAGRWREVFGPVARPTAALMFSPNEYDGAAIVLHALRRTIGDDSFFEVLRRWVSTYDGRSASSADFEKLAADVSGQDLTALFDTWLRSTDVPAFPG